MMVDSRQLLSFDDVLIEPKYTEVGSRRSADTGIQIAGIVLSTPLISSPMDTVTESEMAMTLGRAGGMGILHRFASNQDRIDMVRRVVQCPVEVPVVYSVGASDAEKAFMAELEKEISHNRIDAVCIDLANGYSSIMEDMISYVKNNYNVNIIAGNVATADGYKFLADLGVEAVRVGIGGGSICKTRIQTGIGIPTLQSVLDCFRVKQNMSRYSPDILADGGIRYPADLCKSLVAGASAVICGGIFAGTDEAPGEVIMTNDGSKNKKYRGMASEEVQVEKRGGMKPGTVAEGVSTLIPYKGSVSDVVTEFTGGLQSSMTYRNARDLNNYIGNPESLRRISENGLKESHAYGTRKR